MTPSTDTEQIDAAASLQSRLIMPLGNIGEIIMLIRNVFILIFVGVFIACAASPKGIISGENFKLYTAPDGHTYRIDTRTGKTYMLQVGTFREVNESTMLQLVVGRVYRSEDGKSTYRYTGEGKLEKWGLDRYVIPDTPAQR
jgi:hypothetical protein